MTVYFPSITVHLNSRPFTLNIDRVHSTTVYFNFVQNQTKNFNVLALETFRESTLLCLLIDVRTINLEKNFWLEKFLSRKKLEKV